MIANMPKMETAVFFDSSWKWWHFCYTLLITQTKQLRGSGGDHPGPVPTASWSLVPTDSAFWSTSTSAPEKDMGFQCRARCSKCPQADPAFCSHFEDEKAELQGDEAIHLQSKNQQDTDSPSASPPLQGLTIWCSQYFLCPAIHVLHIYHLHSFSKCLQLTFHWIKERTPSPHHGI